MIADVLQLLVPGGCVGLGWWLARRAAETAMASLEQQLKVSHEQLAECETETRRLGEQAEAASKELAEMRAEAPLLRLAAQQTVKLEAEVRTTRDSLTSALARLASSETKAEQLPALHEELSRLREQLALSQDARLEAQAKATVVSQLESRLNEELAHLEEARAHVARLREDNASLTAKAQEAGHRVIEQASLLEQAETTLREAFKALSAEALASNNQAFLDLAKSALTQFQEGARTDLDDRRAAVSRLVEPLQGALARFETALHALEKERIEAYAGLKEQVLSLKGGQERLRLETAGLIKALRAPVSRGRWGEIQLRRVVEMAGMIENCDFTEQAHLPTDGGHLRPDVVVRLPGGKTSVIDAKVPLTAYLDAQQAEDETSRKALLRDHARQVRNHVSQLADKEYWGQLAGSPDFVVMYLPLESAFAAALQEDPLLIDFAIERSVIPTGPMTLLSHLKAAAYGWRQERIAVNAARISDLGKELYNRIGTLAGHFAAVGTHLGKTVDSYNSAVGSLEHRVLVQARRFRELGAATREDIPELRTMDIGPRGVDGRLETGQGAGSLVLHEGRVETPQLAPSGSSE